MSINRFMLGLRANELRNLAVKHLDIKRGGLHLDAAWTKNRKPGFQPLAASLVQRLLAFAPSGEPTRLYKKHYNRADTRLQAPKHHCSICRPTQPVIWTLI